MIKLHTQKKRGTSILSTIVPKLLLVVTVFLTSFALSSSAQTIYYSKAVATDFNATTSWGANTDGSGAAPASISSTDNFIVSNGAILSLSANATVKNLTVTSGTLNIGANTLNVTPTVGNTSVMLVNGGTFNMIAGSTVNINGKYTHSSGTFNQSGGSMVIDCNDNNTTATSMAYSVSNDGTFWFSAGTLNCTAGTITIVDPPINTVATNTTDIGVSISIGSSGQNWFTGTHTFICGDGVSTTPGNADGFIIETYYSGHSPLNHLTINGNGTNRHATTTNRNSVSYGMSMKGNLTINAGSELRNSNGTGSLMNIGGNIINNGILTVSGTTITTGLTLGVSGGVLVASLTSPQTISGSGVFRNAVTSPTASFSNITINNPFGGVTFAAGTLALGSYTGTVSGTLALGSGKISTNNQTFILGISTAALGTLTYTAGGFGSGTTFGRWYDASGTGTVITAGSNPTVGAGSFPFVSGAFATGYQNRNLHRGTAALATAGRINVLYTESNGLATMATPVTETALIFDKQSNDTWVTSFASGATQTAVNSVCIQAQNMFVTPTATSRILIGGALVGTHGNGSTQPMSQRTAIPAANFAGTYTMATVGSTVYPYTIASGSFDNNAIWSTGVAPACGTIAVISSTDSVYLASGTVTTGSIINNGILSVSGGTLTMGCNKNDSLMNYGKYYISAGTHNMNGRINNLAGSTFTQTGGNINIDGNSGTVGTSVLTGFPLLWFQSSNLLTLTGGKITIINGHIGTATADRAITYVPTTTPYPLITTGHTVQFGNGVSTIPCSSKGFEISTATRFYFGNVILNTIASANNYVQSSTATCVINGDLTITKGAYRTPTTGQIIGGNILNNDTLTSIGTITFGKVLQANMSTPTVSPDSIIQTVGGTGRFKNLTTAATANFTSITVNNAHPSGVRFLNANSLNSASYAGSVSGTLTLTLGYINTGSSKLTLGTTGLLPGTLVNTAGGFTVGSTFERWLGTAVGGATITAGTATALTSTTGTFPFAVEAAVLPYSTSANYKYRSFFLNQTTLATTAGKIAVTLNNGSDGATVLGTPITDGAYTINNRSNTNWTVTNTGAVGSAYSLAASAVNIMGVINGNTRLCLASAPAAGTHQNGTILVHAQRAGIAAASVTGTYYMGASADDYPNRTIASGSFDNPAIWSASTVPVCGSNAVITYTDSVYLNSGTVAVGSLINYGKMSIGGGTLTLGCNKNDSLFNYGKLILSSGDINMNGRINSLSGSTLTQTGGNITIDGNTGTAGTSVATGNALLTIQTNLLTLTGGSLKIVNGHFGSATTDVAINYTSSTSPYPLITTGHTVQFGDGVSTIPCGARGFEIIAGTRLSFGNLIVNTMASANNFVQSSTATCVINGDLTITKGAYRTPTSGQIIGGNIVNNDTLTSIGTITFGKVLQANMLTPTVSPDSIAQTVGGTGVFKNLTAAATANFTSITVNNAHPSGVTFSNANSLNSASYTGSVSGTLSFLLGYINTGANKLTLGISGTATGTLGNTAGGFTVGSTFERWLGTAVGGATITGSIATALTTSAGTFPFAVQAAVLPYSTTANYRYRTFFLNQTTVATTAGKIAVKLNNGATGSTVTSITDTSISAYTINNISNTNWTVTNTGAVGSAYSIAASAQGIYAAANGNSRLCLAAGPALGAHSTGTNFIHSQRTGISAADLSNTYYIGASDNDLPALTIAAGAWEDPSIWIKGVVPTCTDSVVILHAVDINATGNVAKAVAVSTGGILNSLPGSDLTVSSCTAGANNSTFTMDGGTYNNSGGDLIVNGRFVLSSNVAGQFIQTGGNITVDGNSGTLATSALGHTVDMYCHTTSTLQLTGGNFTVVDPCATATTTDMSFKIFPSIAHGSGPNWNLNFGNGLSNDAGGNATAGFGVNLTGTSTFRINGTLNVNMLGGTNRAVICSQVTALNNLNIISGDFRCASSYFTYIKGNIVNNGTFTSPYYLYLSDYNGTAVSASSQAQSISGTGTFRNSATAVTANMYYLQVNNTSTAGVTLNVPISLSYYLYLTAGKVNTDATNVLRLGSTANALTYLVCTAGYINGPFERLFPASTTGTSAFSSSYQFPVSYSDSVFNFYISPTTASTGPVIYRVSVSQPNSGTNGGGVSNMSNKVWTATAVSGGANVTNAFVGLSSPSADFVSTKKIVYSATPNGTFNGNPGGSSYVAGTPNQLRTAAISNADYLANYSYADLVPCSAPVDQGTLASSFMTSTTFTGTITPAASLPTGYLLVRYPAGSVVTNPTDGVTYVNGGTLGLGTTLGNANTTTSFNFAATGLVASTSYDYYAYAFNNNGCAGPTYNTIIPSFMNVTTCAATNGAAGLPAASAVSTTGFTATWTASATTGVDYLVDVSTSSTFATYLSGYNKLNVGTSLTTTLSGLTPGATYYIRVWAALGSCWSAMPTASIVALPCASAAFAPYSTSFETGTAGQLPACWSIATTSATALILGSTTGGVRHYTGPTGTYNQAARTGTSYVSYYYSPSAIDKYFVAPPIDLVAGTSYRPSIYYVTDGVAGWTSLKLVYSTTPFSNPGTVLSNVNTITSVSNANNTTYSLLQGDFVAPTTGTYYVAIACNHTGGPWYLSLDDYSFDVTPPCSGMPSAGTVASSIASSCGNANTTTLTTLPSSYTSLSGITYQWQSSTDSFATAGVDMVGKTNPLSSVSDPKAVGMNYYRLKVTCTTTGDVAYSNIVTSSYTNPQLASTTGNTRCGSGTTTLTATANPGDNISWYTAATGGAPIGTGATFTTPSVAATTNYYASANSGGVSQAIIPGNAWNQYNATAGANYQTTLITGAYMILTVTSPISLTSLDIYPSAAVGTAFTVQARTGSASGTPYASYSDVTNVQNTNATPYTPTAVQTLNIGWSLAPGTYYIGFSDVNPGCYRSPATHPVSTWNIPGVCAVDYYLTPSYQYYFYNPIVFTGCEGTRTAVAATVTTPPALTLDSTATSICNGSTSTSINVTSTLGNYATYTWTPSTGVSNVNGTSVTFNPTANTTYTLTATNVGAASCATTATLPVTVKIVPVVSASVTNASICNGTSTTLNAAGGATSPYCTPTVSSAGVTDDYLDNFTFGSISNLASGDAPTDYANYTAMSTNLVADGTTAYPFTFDFGGTTFLQTLRIFIDYNQNGTFETTESVFNTTTATTGGTGSITVPNTALNGSTRMRVLTKYNSASLATESCALSGYGEYEDYSVSISGGTSAGSYAWNPGSLAGANQTVTPTTTTVYTVTATSGNGCTASASQSVTVKQPTAATINQTKCTSQLPYSWNGQSLTATGTYTKTQTGSNGCDSVTTLNLTVNQSATSTTNTAVCAASLPYSWNGQSLSAAGTYTSSQTAANGCDSIATLNLTIKQATSSTTNTAICAASLPYSWNGQSLSTAGMYTNTQAGANGCDSVATLNLTVKQPTAYSIYTTICAAALPYSWNGQSLTVAGTYTNTQAGANGCDSVTTINLTVNQPTSSTTNTSICAAALPYSWNGQTLTGAGTYTNTQVGANSCDSVATLNLTVKQASTGSETLSGPSPFSWNGGTYTATGIYTYTTTNAVGCDSVVTLNLTIGASTATVNLVTFIQGYYNGAGMAAARYDNLTGSGSATPGNATDVDFVTVELHDAVTPATVVYTTDGMLQTNGTLSVTFPGAAVGNSYYIALKHQNSVQLWSAAAVAITSTTAYNFSTALTQAYTDGSTDPMAFLATGVYGMYSGDINQDEYIDGSDYSVYEVDVDNSTNLGLFSLPSDLNGDTYVDGSDFPLFDINSSNSLYSQHP